MAGSAGRRTVRPMPCRIWCGEKQPPSFSGEAKRLKNLRTETLWLRRCLGLGPEQAHLGRAGLQAAAQTDSIFVFSVCALNGLTM